MNEKIESLIKSHQVFAFMKGTPDMPACRFSAQMKDIFDGLKIQFQGFNVLEDFQMREAIKDFTGWPTLPQIFIKGNFVGGVDILQELADSGELSKMTA